MALIRFTIQKLKKSRQKDAVSAFKAVAIPGLLSQSPKQELINTNWIEEEACPPEDLGYYKVECDRENEHGTGNKRRKPHDYN